MAEEEKKDEETSDPEPAQQDSSPSSVETKVVTKESKDPKESQDPKEFSEPKKKKEKEISENEVVIKRSVLEAILIKQKNQEEQIEMLTEVSDKARLHRWQAKHQGKIIRRAKIGTWLHEGKEHYINGWEMVKDEVGVRNGTVYEIQIIRLFLYNEDKDPILVEVNYLDFSRNVGRKWGDIIKEAKTTDGETRTLKFQDGQEIEVDIRFINL